MSHRMALWISATVSIALALIVSVVLIDPGNSSADQIDSSYEAQLIPNSPSEPREGYDADSDADYDEHDDEDDGYDKRDDDHKEYDNHGNDDEHEDDHDDD